MTDVESPQVWPAVTVVMPVRNEAASVAESVESALGQDYPGDVEVVVADAMSEDGTRQALADLPGVRIVDNPDRTTPAGLNRAIEAANGEVIVRCDAHAVLPPGYIRRAVELLTETGADNVGGVQRAVGSMPMQRAIAYAMSSPIGVGDARFHYGGQPGPVDTVYLGVFRRSVFDRVGWFDERLARNQDYELNIRIRQGGGVVYFHPDLEVVYRPRATLAQLWRQYYDYGVWKRQVARLHPSSLRLRQLAAPLLIVGLVVSAVLAAVGRWGWAAVIPGAWLTLLAVGTVWTVIKRRSAAGLLFGLAVATMHLAWGFGFMTGQSASSPS